MVRYTSRESIGELVLRRPEAGNAISPQLAEELAGLMDQISDDSDVKVLIVTGAGKDFSIGADAEVVDDLDENGVVMDRPGVASLLQAFDRPVIAAVNGDALGQGLELALACDLRVCGENSRFGLPQIAGGDIPRDGGTQRLARLVGRGMALQMILTGEIIDAREALRIGLVNWVASDDAVRAKALETARDMAAKAPFALKYVKEAIAKGMDMTLSQGLRLEADLYALLHTTRDRREGIEAFRDKRTPEFQGK